MRKRKDTYEFQNVAEIVVDADAFGMCVRLAYRLDSINILNAQT